MCHLSTSQRFTRRSIGQSRHWIGSVEQRAQPINCVKQDPSFRTFHSLPRFQAILERMQLR